MATTDHLCTELVFLTGSAVRWQLLVALAEEPRDFGTLREDLEVPRSTLNRNLTKLAEEGWVHERTDRTYRLTALGDFFIEQFTHIEDVMTIIDRLSEYPDSFPVGEWAFDVSRLADADYMSAAPNEPYSVIGLTPSHQLDPEVDDASFDASAFPEDANVEFHVWEGGMPGVLFETTDPEIVTWAAEEFERIYDRSTLAAEHAE